MTRDVSPDLKRIRLFLTEEHPCSYLPDKFATTAFVDPEVFVDEALYSRITQLGFRRSGKYYYLPHCQRCNSCISSRVPVNQFKPNRQQRRCLAANKDVQVVEKKAVNLQEHYSLYEHYIRSRHDDGDMHPPSLDQYRDFIGEGREDTGYLEFRLNSMLIGCAVFDRLNDGLSAIYTYFSPDLPKRSLGTLAILAQIASVKQRGLSYLYLGYWIRNCQKMRYKTRFQPIELFIGNRWQLMDKTQTHN